MLRSDMLKLAYELGANQAVLAMEKTSGPATATLEEFFPWLLSRARRGATSAAEAGGRRLAPPTVTVPFDAHQSLLRSREALSQARAEHPVRAKMLEVADKLRSPWSAAKQPVPTANVARVQHAPQPAPAGLTPPQAPPYRGPAGEPAFSTPPPPAPVPPATPPPTAATAPTLTPPTVAPVQPGQQSFAFGQGPAPVAPRRMDGMRQGAQAAGPAGQRELGFGQAQPAQPRNIEGMRRGPQAEAGLTPPQVPAYRGPAAEPPASPLSAPQVGEAAKAPKGKSKAKGKAKGTKEPAAQPKATLTPPTVGEEWGWAAEAQPAAAAAPGKFTPHSEWGWSEGAAQPAAKGTGQAAAKGTAPAENAAATSPKFTENLPAARDLEKVPLTQAEVADAAGRLEKIRALPLEEQAAAMQALSENPVTSAALSHVKDLGSTGGLGSLATTVLPTAGLAGLGYLADDERGALAGAGLGLGARVGAGGLLNKAREFRGISSALGRGEPALQTMGLGWKSPEVQKALMAGGAAGLGGGALGAVAGDRLFEKKKPWYQEMMGLVPPAMGALNQVAVPYLQMRRGLTPEQIYGYEQSLGLTPSQGGY